MNPAYWVIVAVFAALTLVAADLFAQWWRER
jgi:hypothetical protein